MVININQILKKALEKVKPSEEEIKDIGEILKNFLDKLKKNIKTSRIKAEVFVGGSFAKNTLIKKDYYDIDIFIRFDKKYKNGELSDLTKKILKKAKMKNISLIHGSRDYYRIKFSPSLFFEVIPVKKIKSPKEAENITDLSYSHVSYIKRKVKNKKILDDIRLAKAFCHANQCYGAESYINGFSGYALELLVYYYKGFLKFIKAMGKAKPREKIIIDIEKHYKNKQRVMMDINAAKLQSPIILIDPTYKQRNALAALSEETFDNFQKVCKNFLKNPSLKAFETEKINLEEIKKQTKKRDNEFVLLEAKTTKQEGDIAGSKLFKFYKHLAEELRNYFIIKEHGFEYPNKGKTARYFFVAKKRDEILISGPLLSQKKHVKKFKSKHKSTFTKQGRIYSRLKIKTNLKQFIKNWKNKHKKKIKEMAISDLKIIGF